MAVRMKSVGEKKWIWAVDAFHDQPSSQWRAVEALRAWQPETPLSILPVASLAIGQFNPGRMEFEDQWHDLATRAERNLEKLLKTREEAGVLAPRVLRQENPAIASGVDSLVRFALEQGAEGIVLTSHGRRGPIRLLLGSFAETLVLRSPLPVLIVNPKAARPKRIELIVFPTDFSESSEEAFGRTLAVASQLKARVVLFHKVSTLYPEFGNSAHSDIIHIDPLEARRTELLSHGEAWVQAAEKLGVPAKFQLEFKPGRVLPALLKFLERSGGNTMVAMASTSGPLRSVLLGSLSRQVLRDCRQPVLIFHAEQDSLSRVFLTEWNRLAVANTANPILR